MIPGDKTGSIRTSGSIGITSAVIRRNGDVLPTELIDGHVCGVWRPTDGRIEIRAFDSLSREVWDAIAHEAESLGALIATRDPAT